MNNIDIKKNEYGLPILTKEIINVIFDCVYDMPIEDFKHAAFPDNYLPETKKLLEDNYFKSFMIMIEYMTRFNHSHRWEQKSRTYKYLSQIFEFEINSEGTDRWLGRAIAIKDLYRMSQETLLEVMKLVDIKK